MGYWRSTASRTFARCALGKSSRRDTETEALTRRVRGVKQRSSSLRDLRMKELKTGVMAHTLMESPIGPLLLAGDERGLHLVHFVNGRRPKSPSPTWVEDKN